jgi:hypothetical protein
VRSRDDAGHQMARVYREGQHAVVGAIGATLDVDAIYREARKNTPR